MELDKETAEYLVEKSKELLTIQTDSYKQKQSNAATIVAANAIFIPVFLSGLSDAEKWVKYAAVLPIILSAGALVYLLRVYVSKPLQRGLALANYDDTINKKYAEALLFEIAVNKDSYTANKIVVDKATTHYDYGVWATIVTIPISVFLLMTSVYCKQESDVVKIEVSNLNSILKNDTLLLNSKKTLIIPITTKSK